MPAIAAILDALPASVHTRVIAEVDTPDAECPLESAAEVGATWLHRDDRPPGESQALIDAVRAVELPEGVLYAWGGGEFRTMSEIGKHLRRDRGFRLSDVCAIGYW